MWDSAGAPEVEWATWEFKFRFGRLTRSRTPRPFTEFGAVQAWVGIGFSRVELNVRKPFLAAGPGALQPILRKIFSLGCES